MRPSRLTIQAFGPYSNRQVIDFRDAVEAGLFGIYGPTGAGKSTIFSAMTFALFGEAAKSEQDVQSLRCDLAHPSLATEVEFVFDIGERRFVILRRPDQLRERLARRRRRWGCRRGGRGRDGGRADQAPLGRQPAPGVSVSLRRRPAGAQPRARA